MTRIQERRALTTLIALLVAAGVAVAVYFIFIKKTSHPASPHKTVTLYSGADLPNAVSKVGNPVYWLGPKASDSYELTLITDGRSYVRYLPRFVRVDSPNPYLTVGSYSGFQNPTASLQALANQPGNHTFTVPGGGLGLASNGASNAYVAYPGVKVEIEVYDPVPGKAKQFAQSGQLTPIR